MNNYSSLQQMLHRIALSFQPLREAMFDIEASIISTTSTHDKHVFVSGLARSGSTILLNAVYESGEFSSLSYRDMPFILAPNIWSKISPNTKVADSYERAHKDGISISLESPEALEEVFWMTFSQQQAQTKEKFKRYVELVAKRYSLSRYLSKNNQNIKRLEFISEIFPNSKILIPFREPLQQAYSLFLQHQRFIEYSKKKSLHLKVHGIDRSYRIWP